VPVAVVAGAASALVLSSVLPDLSPLGPPLGYANANAALYVLVAVAAAMVAVVFSSGPAVAVAVPLGVAFAMAAVVSGSTTGVVVLGLGLVLLGARAVGSWRGLLLCCTVAVQLAVGFTALSGVAALDGPDLGIGIRVVDERRVLLWRDAAVISRRHPVTGAGPGRFQVESPTARSDSDARWAHSGFLQMAAEEGAVGFALLLAAFGWGFARVWVRERDAGGDAFAALGALALAALALHASVDYVLHFAAVPLVGAALVGAATAAPAVPRDQRARPGAGIRCSLLRAR
jgi:O-antigen ligase